jgi:hypothetical protein
LRSTFARRDNLARAQGFAESLCVKSSWQKVTRRTCLCKRSLRRKVQSFTVIFDMTIVAAPCRYRVQRMLTMNSIAWHMVTD